MASAVNPIASSVATQVPTAAAPAPSSSAPSKETFLQLLVTQIKNQDPLNPTDSVQFVSQLAQFSELEQVIAIRQDLENRTANSPANRRTMHLFGPSVITISGDAAESVSARQ
jgi:flagellar basal-body rod modification protein FlgD